MAEQQVALVTGANKGIGFEIARQLGKRGITVLVGARDPERGQEAAQRLQSDGLKAEFIHLDVTKQETIDAAAERIRNEYGRLDVLVNNAGIFIESKPPSEVDLSRVRATYETNFFGPLAVTQALLPLIRKAHAGRIVNISSGLGSIGRMSTPGSPYSAFNVAGYNTSKSALNALTVAFANELRNTPIKVNAADPGYVATDLNNHSGPRTVEQGAAEPVRLATLGPDGPTGGFFNDDGPVPW